MRRKLKATFQVIGHDSYTLRAPAGTKVTVESFTQWKEKFDEEMRALNPKEDLIKGKLTGKQMFIRDKALAESDLKFDGADDVDVDETLFQDDELAELEDE